MNPDQKTLEEKFKKSPFDTQKVLTSLEVANKVAKIGEDNGLMLDKQSDLFDEISFVLLGLTHPNEFIPHLRKRLGVSDDVVNKIADEINEQVFKEIRESLKKIHDNPSSLESHQEATPQSREEILSDIENPVPSSEHSREETTNPLPQENVPVQPTTPMKGPRIEKLIPVTKVFEEDKPTTSVPTETTPAPAELSIADAKLNNPVGAPRVVEIRKIQNKEEKREYKADPYRESV